MKDPFGDDEGDFDLNYLISRHLKVYIRNNLVFLEKFQLSIAVGAAINDGRSFWSLPSDERGEWNNEPTIDQNSAVATFWNEKVLKYLKQTNHEVNDHSLITLL